MPTLPVRALHRTAWWRVPLVRNPALRASPSARSTTIVASPYSHAPPSSNIAAMSINQKLEEALNNQVIAEHQAALVYTQLAYELDRLSLTGMSAWMFAQADEEREHAQRFADHLIDRDSRVNLKTIELPEIKIESALEAFELSLAHEKKVSAMIRDLVRVAEEVKDIDSRPLLDSFLSEQVEEEATVGEIIDRLKMVGADGSGLLRLDAQLGGRE
ncbi:ferritin [Corynebacterium urealyticum DSM 7111]|nr:ferritin [Corynebacterium urealyticum DSM 7111]